MFPVTFMHPPARHSSRLGQRLQVALGAAAALTAISLSPGSAQAYVVTVGGAQYDLSTYTFTPNQYNASKTFYDAIFQAQPWHGNYNATYSFGQVITQSIWNALYPVSAIQAGSPVDGYFNANIGIMSLVPTVLNMMTGSANGSGTLAGCLDSNPVTCLGPGNSGYSANQYSALIMETALFRSLLTRRTYGLVLGRFPRFQVPSLLSEPLPPSASAAS
jgi:hypothetical protein